ncbi:hypothetical protein [Nocardia otitidiscaviarum]|uniref:hypothetical protein n=1 Tax=Nocardia otitidiscaviarum TaxID=1823 RepID=UPI0004A74DE8|nr:hypothetical protein [Nocardia otitidiscaviarum]
MTEPGPVTHSTSLGDATAWWRIVDGVATVAAARDRDRDLRMPHGRGIDLGKCFTLFPELKELWWKVLEEREKMHPGGKPRCGRISGT